MTVVDAVTNDPKASVSITQADALPGNATIEVTAEDGTKQTYTVKFTLGEEPQKEKYNLTIKAGTGGKIITGNSGEYEENEIISIKAEANAGYVFNKWTSTNGGTFADANKAATTFTMPANDTTIKAEFTYVGTGDDEDEDEDTTGPVVTPTPTPTPAAAYQAEVSGTGDTTVSLTVEVDADNGIATVDLGTFEIADIFGESGTTVINMPVVPEADTYTLSIPAATLAGGERTLTFAAEVGNITIPENMLDNITGGGEDKVGISISEGDKSNLPDDVAKEIGDRPVIQLTMTINGKQIEWNNANAPVTVEIPYTPTTEELLDPEHIVVWYIDGSGNVISIPNGRYNPETGTVTFTTTHFSYYAVSYVHKTFSDLSVAEWARKPIEVLASKGIIKGIGENTYVPNANITRADYLLLLVRTLELKADFNSNFDDVQPGAYYYEAVGIAKALGITNGVGNNKFNPYENISRQDMMVLTARALEVFKGLKAENDTSILNQFSDNGEISEYAKESLATLVKEELIVGNQNRLFPKDKTTRAEAAMFIYRIYNKFPY